MMHPDQLFTVRQLQHQDLLAEAERVRACGEYAGGMAGARTWLATSLRRVGVLRARGAVEKAPGDGIAA